MASKFITYTKHGVAESSSLLATNSGAHMVNFVADVDVDNGSLVAIGDYAGDEVWKVKKATASDSVFLILSSEDIYADYTKKCKEVENFYNAAGEIMRGYALAIGDKFALNDVAIDGKPEVGNYLIVGGEDYFGKISATIPEGTKFAAKLYDVASNGHFRFIVVAN